MALLRAVRDKFAAGFHHAFQGECVKAALRKEPGRELAIAFAGGAAILCASLANFLNYNDYPLLRPEVGIVRPACSPSRRRWPSSMSRSGSGGARSSKDCSRSCSSTSTPISSCSPAPWASRSAWCVVAPVLLPAAMAVIGAVVLASKALGLAGRVEWISVEKGAQPRASRSRAGKPAMVHIIFDEHIGLEGLRSEGPEGQRLSDELRNFYLAHGFAVYGGAYSRHFHTVTRSPTSSITVGDWRKLRRETSNHGTDGALEALVDSGYRLTIFQSDFVDYCTGAEFYECVSYDSSSSGRRWRRRWTLPTAPR